MNTTGPRKEAHGARLEAPAGQMQLPAPPADKLYTAMGLCVTFHPVSAPDLQHFVFDVLDDPSLLEARMAEVTTHADVRDVVRSMFERALDAVDLLDAGSDPEEPDGIDDEDGPADPADMIRLLAAMVAGCRGPYWLAHSGLSSLDHHPAYQQFQHLAAVGTGRIRQIPDRSEWSFMQARMATGFLPPAAVESLADDLRTDTALRDALGPWGVESLGAALRHAAEHGLGLIEATGVWSPGLLLSDRRHLRGAEGMSNGTTPGQGPTALQVAVECPDCGLFNVPGATTCDCGRDIIGAPHRARETHNLRAWAIVGVAMIVFTGKLASGGVSAADVVALLLMSGVGVYAMRR